MLQSSRGDHVVISHFEELPQSNVFLLQSISTSDTHEMALVPLYTEIRTAAMLIFMTTRNSEVQSVGENHANFKESMQIICFASSLLPEVCYRKKFYGQYFISSHASFLLLRLFEGNCDVHLFKHKLKPLICILPAMSNRYGIGPCVTHTAVLCSWVLIQALIHSCF